MSHAGSLSSVRSESYAALTRESLIKLIDEVPEWYPEHKRKFAHLPIEERRFDKRYGVDPRSTEWQISDFTVAPGDLLLLYLGMGDASYNGGVNWVDAYGKDLQSGQYVQAGNDFPCPGANAWGVFCSAGSSWFHNTTEPIGYGPGLFLDPNAGYWLINNQDAGVLYYRMSDNYNQDNQADVNNPLYFTAGLLPARDLFKHILKTRFSEGG